MISRMFVQWIVVRNFELQIAYAEYSLAKVATGPESIPAGFCVCFCSRESSISEKPDPEPESVLFLSVTGVCTVFVNVIASVQNKHC